MLIGAALMVGFQIISIQLPYLYLCFFYYFGLYGVTSWRQIIWYIILEYCKEYNFCQQPFNQIFYCKSYTHFVMGCRLIYKVDEPPKPKELNPAQSSLWK